VTLTIAQPGIAISAFSHAPCLAAPSQHENHQPRSNQQAKNEEVLSMPSNHRRKNFNPPHT
jgi:hypothetical protein